MALLPTEQLTEREAYLFKVYSEARACVTGSMVELYKKLELDSFKFFHLLDSDIEFKTAIMRGLSDSRAERLLELESSLINLALGVTVEEEKTVDSPEDGITVTKTVKKLPPNLAALQVLLEKYQGSSWTVTQKVDITSGRDPREIDYSILTQAQLKQLAQGHGNSGGNKQ